MQRVVRIWNDLQIPVYTFIRSIKKRVNNLNKKLYNKKIIVRLNLFCVILGPHWVHRLLLKIINTIVYYYIILYHWLQSTLLCIYLSIYIMCCNWVKNEKNHIRTKSIITTSRSMDALPVTLHQSPAGVIFFGIIRVYYSANEVFGKFIKKPTRP